MFGSTRARKRLCLSTALLLIISFSPLFASAHADSAQTKHVFRLQYKQTGFSLQVPIDIEGKEVVFKKEPDFGGRAITRGALQTGQDESSFIGFACDKTGGELYLDSNQNLDLTDDPVYRSNAAQPFQRFQNVKFMLKVGELSVPYVIDFDFFGPFGPSASVRSGWQSEIELNGKKWLLAVVDNMDGIIGKVPSLEEPSDFSDPFDLTSLLGLPGSDVLILKTGDAAEEVSTDKPAGTDFFPVQMPDFFEEMSDPDRFPVPQRLSFDAASYDLAFAFEPGETQTELVATFTESDAPMGEMKIGGQFIKRLVLEEDARDGLSLVILDSPAATVAIPGGEYSTERVDLEDARSGKLLRAEPYDSRVVIAANQSAVLNIGGPLKHDLSVDRRGRTLEFEYALVGAGGENYTDTEPTAPFLQSAEGKPKFYIYRGDTTIASGSFEYG